VEQTTRWTPLLVSAAVLLAVAALAPSLSRADTVTLRSGKLDRLVKIRDVREGRLHYRPTAGGEVSHRLPEIRLVEVPRLDDLNAAEGDFDAGRYAEAIRRYQVFLGGARPRWQKRWARYRLLRAYDELGEFAKVVEQYCQLVTYMPESVDMLMPKNWPDPSSTFYADALAVLDQARRQPASEATAEALDRLSRRIKFKIKDHTPAVEVSPQASSDSEALEPETESEPLDPQIAKRLALIEEAFDRRAYGRAVELADEVLMDVDRERAAAVLLLRGKALFNLARSADGYYEAALSLMRVVIHLPDTESAGESAYYAALCMERSGNIPAAQRLLKEAESLAGRDEDLKRHIGLSLKRVQERMGGRGGRERDKVR
jgi:tetratricopeptide (TPR) repeat protein